MRTLITFLTLFVYYSSGAQHKKHIILDKETSEPVRYATIKLLNKPGGTVSNEKGEFTLEFLPSDSVFITSVSYEPLLTVGNSLRTTIFLVPSKKTLEPVIIATKQQGEKFNLGWKGDIDDANITWGSFNGKDEFAQLINLPDSNSDYVLSSVVIAVKKSGFSRDLILHVYLVDSFSGLPGDELLTKKISVAKTKKGRALVDLRKENIVFRSQKQFYMGVSWDPSRKPGDMGPGLHLSGKSTEKLVSRTLQNINLNWFVFGEKIQLNNREMKVGGTFSVEVIELK